MSVSNISPMNYAWREWCELWEAAVGFWGVAGGETIMFAGETIASGLSAAGT